MVGMVHHLLVRVIHDSRFYFVAPFIVNERRRVIGAPGPSSVHQYSDKLIAKEIKKRRKNFRLAIHSRRSIIRENYRSKLAIVGVFPFIVRVRGSAI